MNSKALYLAWVRTSFPQVYSRAVSAVLSPKSQMAGLGDDLTDSLNLYAPTFDSSDAVPIDSSVSDAVNQAAANPSTDWGNIFSNIANAVGVIAPTIVQTQAQQDLLKINTQRAAQGLPPLTANGYPVTASMLAPATGTSAQLESYLSGSSGMLFLLGELGLGAVLLLKGGRSAT